MAQDRKLQSIARKLVSASLQDGRVSETRVQAVLEMLRKQPPRQRREILQVYLRLLRREEARSRLVIEYAGPLSDSARDEIVSTMTAKAGRRLTVETREVPDLIGGVRVRLGDDVFDASIESRLRQLSNAQ